MAPRAAGRLRQRVASMLTPPAVPASPLQVVQQMVTRAGLRPDRLLLVGGFGSSSYLQLKLENRFGAWRHLLHGAAPTQRRAACTASCTAAFLNPSSLPPLPGRPAPLHRQLRGRPALPALRLRRSGGGRRALPAARQRPGPLSRHRALGCWAHRIGGRMKGLTARASSAQQHEADRVPPSLERGQSLLSSVLPSARM